MDLSKHRKREGELRNRDRRRVRGVSPTRERVTAASGETVTSAQTTVTLEDKTD